MIKSLYIPDEQRQIISDAQKIADNYKQSLSEWIFELIKKEVIKQKLYTGE